MRFAYFLSMAVAVALLGAGALPAGASDGRRVVHLPDGTGVDLGPYARVVERAADEGRVAALAGGYLERNLPGDAAAVLAYAVRARPERAAEIADVAAMLADRYPNRAAIAPIFGTLAAEPAMPPDLLAAALAAASLPARVQEMARIAAGLPGTGREGGPAVSEEVARDSAPGETDGAAADSPEAAPARTAGEVFRGTILPETLRIGSGRAGGAQSAPAPGADGGAS